jgi:toxoflavin biosynthesis protein ToxD
MDVDSIPLGRDFRQVLKDSITASDVVLAIIGPRWAAAQVVQGFRRIDDPQDFVRIEVETSLTTGIPIVPVFTQGMSMPLLRDELPVSLSDLQYRNAIDVRSDQHFGYDIEQLIERLVPLLRDAQSAAPAGTSQDTYVGDEVPLSSRMIDLGYRLEILNGQRVIVPPVCEVGAGEFLMGSNPIRDSGAHEDEEPQHRVSLPTFRVARFAVTVIEYACFLRATGRATPRSSYNQLQWVQQLSRLDHPVVNVNWRDTLAYAAWLQERTEQHWVLLSEAEWEKAARWNSSASTARIYPWGDAFDSTRCNISEGGRGGTTPVGFYPNGASPCNAEDMTGNVWEWTSSIYRPYPFGSSAAVRSAEDLQNPVLRGGSWGSDARGARAAFRYDNDPNNSNNTIGFRIGLRPDR